MKAGFPPVPELILGIPSLESLIDLLFHMEKNYRQTRMDSKKRPTKSCYSEMEATDKKDCFSKTN
jgi:hypothetical protein